MSPLVDRSMRRVSGVSFGNGGSSENWLPHRLRTQPPLLLGRPCQLPTASTPLRFLAPFSSCWYGRRNRRRDPGHPECQVTTASPYFVTTNGFVIPSTFFVIGRGTDRASRENQPTILPRILGITHGMSISLVHNIYYLSGRRGSWERRWWTSGNNWRGKSEANSD